MHTHRSFPQEQRLIFQQDGPGGMEVLGEKTPTVPDLSPMESTKSVAQLEQATITAETGVNAATETALGGVKTSIEAPFHQIGLTAETAAGLGIGLGVIALGIGGARYAYRKALGKTNALRTERA